MDELKVGDVVQYGTSESRNEKFLTLRPIGVLLAPSGGYCYNPRHKGIPCTLWKVQWILVKDQYDYYHSCCMTVIGHMEVPDEPTDVR